MKSRLSVSSIQYVYKIYLHLKEPAICTHKNTDTTAIIINHYYDMMIDFIWIG